MMPMRTASGKILPFGLTKKVVRHAAVGGANAIRDMDYVDSMLSIWANEGRENGLRNAALMATGFNTALRASDILSMTIGMVRNNNDTIKDYFTLVEKKTNKVRRVYVNSVLKKYLLNYLSVLDGKADSSFLWLSRQGHNSPITVRRFNQMMKETVAYIGLPTDKKISTHTLRKTYARFIYDNATDKQHALTLISHMLNHSSMKTTMIYLDITNDEVEALTMTNEVGGRALEKTVKL